ncbi:aldo/keto reductase [Spirulina sp. CS-785/01]|uniref:aldo/keto reductase n=1 Tax=Spirulina sp. CS-785/01 TaxID=3021716 RepID=UPI0023307B4E|nr:aldo/keto reductase [Spirulina sp. CS-785/01]MDB9314834.1 aldo/keto reductase [Spirulina sp. CS-785/01]
MTYRRFGKTDLPLSVFSLGTMRCLSGLSQFEQVVQTAVSGGINHLETARGYGKSEVYLGETLSRLSLRRDHLYITTKLPPTPDAATMEGWIEESLQRLQLDYIDGLALHGINTWEHLEWVTRPEGCRKALEGAIASKKIHHLGFSTHAPLEVILAAIETDLFEFINLHYYYFFQHNEPALTLAAEKDMGVFIISPADKGGQLYNPPNPLKQLCSPLTPLEFNYRFLLADPRITTLSMGAATPEELSTPLQLANRTQPLDETEKAVMERLEGRMMEQLQGDHCRQCYQCLPCPEVINIPEVLRLRNLAVSYEMQGFGEYRYGMFENAGHWFWGRKGSRCTECGDCLPRCPENLDIPRLLQDTHQRLNGKPRRRLWDT